MCSSCIYLYIQHMEPVLRHNFFSFKLYCFLRFNVAFKRLLFIYKPWELIIVLINFAWNVLMIRNWNRNRIDNLSKITFANCHFSRNFGGRPYLFCCTWWLWILCGCSSEAVKLNLVNSVPTFFWTYLRKIPKAEWIKKNKNNFLNV